MEITMHMKYLLSPIVGLSLLGCGSLEKPSYSASLSGQSKYIAALGFTVEDTPVIQGDASVTLNGLKMGETKVPVTAGGWANYNIERNMISEVDAYISTEIDVSPARLKLGVSQFEFMGPLEAFPDTTDIHAKVSFPTFPYVTPSFTLRYADYQIGEGLYYEGALRKDIDLGGGFTANLAGSAGGMNDYFVNHEGLYHATFKWGVKRSFDNGASVSFDVVRREKLADITTDDTGFGLTLGWDF